MTDKGPLGDDATPPQSELYPALQVPWQTPTELECTGTDDDRRAIEIARQMLDNPMQGFTPSAAPACHAERLERLHQILSPFPGLKRSHQLH